MISEVGQFAFETSVVFFEISSRMLLIVFCRELQRGRITIVFSHRNLFNVPGKIFRFCINIQTVMVRYTNMDYPTVKIEFILPMK
jgi:hypothetical protein